MICRQRHWFSFWQRAAFLISTIFIFVPALSAQERTIAVDGQVRDKTNTPIAGATVTFQSSGGIRRSRTNRAGVYAFHNLAPGVYSVRVEARRFQSYEDSAYRVAGPRNAHLNVTLDLAPIKQEIVVSSGEKPLSIEPENTATTITLQGAGLAGLPDDPNDFAAAIQALAGPSALGPSDPLVFVNGFILNQLPPKETIREIRINDNPFSAENDRPATNRIEATTKAGSRQVHGEGYLNWDAGWWDAANPFTRPLPPNPSRLYGGNVAGPVTSRATFFTSIERTTIDFQNAVNATVLNASLLPTPLVENEPDPETRLLLSPQLDVTLNKTNTLMARYSSSRYSLPREGVGGTALPESGYETFSRQQTAQISETAVLSPRSVNEVKFQFLRNDLVSKPYSLTPAIAVDGAFTTGKSSSALSMLRQNQWEFQNNLSNVFGTHALRMGIRLRGETDHESLEKNQTGTYSFSAGSGAALNPDNTPVRDANGAPVIVPLSPLERYRRTILFQQEGIAPADIRALGGGASSFSATIGYPLANARQYDVGVYLQDNWHLLPNLLLGAGVRYEKQTNLHDSSNVGPRFSIAWAPGRAGKKDPHTVLRGGVGLFYERLDPSLVLLTHHSQSPRWRYTTSDPSVLDFFPTAPPLSSLAPFATAADTLQMGSPLRAPAVLQTTIGIEQQLPWKTRLSAGFTQANTFHGLLLVDASPFQRGSPRTLLLESSGLLTQWQLKVELSNHLSKRVNLSADYVLNRANSDTDGTTNPAAAPNSLQDELGRSLKDIHHNFTLTGSWDIPWGVRLSPFIVASSNRPFNIITGRYQDEDFPYTGRPVLATDPAQPDVIVTQYGAFRLNPSPGEIAIARNYGQGPPFFSASFRLSKTFAFGESLDSAQSGSNTVGSGTEGRYHLVISAQVINFTNHLNPGLPEGNLSSPQFGQSTSLAPGFNFGGGAAVYHRQLQANRRLELQLRFTF